MSKSKYFGRDLICTQDWRIDELEDILSLAKKMKEDRYSPKYSYLLLHKTFIMFFFNPSVRTRESFEAAMTELGGHAQFIEPKTMRLKTKKTAGETMEDAARVMSSYAAGLGIRILEDKITKYGEGDKLLREYASYASIPVLNMADDRFHPFQVLADVMGMRESLGELKGKTLLQYWGHGALARSWCSVQESLLLNSRLGMNIRLAYPDGYDLDKEVIETVKENCKKSGSDFELSHNPIDCYNGVDVVYSRNWMSPDAYKSGVLDKEGEIKKAMKYTDWICDSKKMRLTNNALFIHPMPVDRGHEVTDEVASGKRSIIYRIAENRLHVQKAAMVLVMSDLF